MKRTTYYYHTARDILSHIQYATLATVSEDGRPWNSPVWAMHDAANFIGGAVRRVYKAVPEKIWMNDAEFDSQGTFVRDYRASLSIKRLCSYIALRRKD